MKNRLLLKIIIPTLAVFLDARVCLAQQSSEMHELKEEAATQLLKAGVQFDAKALPIDSSLLPGNIFNKELATALLRVPEKKDKQWYRVPSWQAGIWRCEQATSTRLVLYKNGRPVEAEPAGTYKAAGEFDLGQLKDKNGDIWGRYFSNDWTETEHAAGLSYSYVVFQSAGNGSYPDRYTEMVSFRVNSKSHQIDKVSRSKNWTRLNNVAPGLIKEETVWTVLDDSGNPKLTSWNFSMARRACEFSASENLPVDQEELEESFRAFCTAEGLGDLLPR